MRRNFTKAMSMAIALAGLTGAGQVAHTQSLAAAADNTVEYKATRERKAKKKNYRQQCDRRA